MSANPRRGLNQQARSATPNGRSYLWFNANPKGEAREIWLHLTCMEMFAMRRDTATNAVVGSETLARPAP